MAKQKKSIQIESLTHEEAKRLNIPTAEMQSFYAGQKGAAPLSISYPRSTPLEPGERRERNPDLDPQLVWRGKDEQDWSDLVVHAPPLYIQEKVHPKVIIEDLRRQSRRSGRWSVVGGQSTNHQPLRTDHSFQPDLFADFNGLPDREARLEFYQHDQNWSNRMILGDSLQVMASLAEREGLRGQVQCIYLDPPYGIRFNSNWQVSTRSRDVKDDQISREPEQIKAFRDTWKDEIHSYLTYLRDRVTVSRDLLHQSGSIFIQIGEENIHRVRSLMDETFGEDNFINTISFAKTSGKGSMFLDNTFDHIVWYAKDKESAKYRRLFVNKSVVLLDEQYTQIDEYREQTRAGDAKFMPGDMSSQGASEAGTYPFAHQGTIYHLPPNTHWKASRSGLPRLARAERLAGIGKRLRYKRYADDFRVVTFSNLWDDTVISGYADPKLFIVTSYP